MSKEFKIEEFEGKVFTSEAEYSAYLADKGLKELAEALDKIAEQEALYDRLEHKEPSLLDEGYLE